MEPKTLRLSTLYGFILAPPYHCIQRAPFLLWSSSRQLEPTVFLIKSHTINAFPPIFFFFSSETEEPQTNNTNKQPKKGRTTLLGGEDKRFVFFLGGKGKNATKRYLRLQEVKQTRGVLLQKKKKKTKGVGWELSEGKHSRLQEGETIKIGEKWEELVNEPKTTNEEQDRSRRGKEVQV